MNTTVIVGRHHLLWGDLTKGAVQQLMAGELADVIYTDPPWGPGALQMFATIAGEELPGGSKVAWKAFLPLFANTLATHSKHTAPIFVEMGLRWTEELDLAMNEAGLHHYGSWTATYGQKKTPKPFKITMFSHVNPLLSEGAALTSLADLLDLELVGSLHGEALTETILRSTINPGDLVLDPCTGLGMTARWAHRLQANFRGVELSRERLAKTIEWLKAQ